MNVIAVLERADLSLPEVEVALRRSQRVLVEAVKELIAARGDAQRLAAATKQYVLARDLAATLSALAEKLAVEAVAAPQRWAA